MYYGFGSDETNPKTNNLTYKNANGAAVDDEDDDGDGISSICSFEGCRGERTEHRRTTTTAPSEMIKNLIWEYMYSCCFGCCCLVFRNIVLFSTLFHTPSSILNESFGAARHRFREGVRTRALYYYFIRIGWARWTVGDEGEGDGDGKMEQE